MKQAALYAMTIAICVSAVSYLLELGSALPRPGGHFASEMRPSGNPLGEDSLIDIFQLRFESNLQHPLSQLLLQILIIVGASKLAATALKRLDVPAVVGEMAAGILLGPSLLGLLAPSLFQFLFPTDSIGALKLLGQVGVLLYMFVVGTDFSTHKLLPRAQSAVVVSHTSIIIPFLLGVALAYLLFADMAGHRATFTTFALFVGISLSITAFPVLARILRERGLSHTELGNTAIACAAIDDVTAWSIMAFVIAVANSNSLIGSWVSLGMVALFVMLMIAGVRPLLRYLLRNCSTGEPSNGTLGLVMCVALAAALSTELLGVHALFGAFLAGTIVPNHLDLRRRIGSRIEQFSSTMLLPLFFAFTGLRMELSLLSTPREWLLCLLIILVATAGKLVVGAASARVGGMNWRESLQLGALMNTRGLMELIALNIAYDLGIFSPRIFTMLVLMALATTFMTSPLLSLFSLREARSDTLNTRQARSVSDPSNEVV